MSRVHTAVDRQDHHGAEASRPMAADSIVKTISGNNDAGDRAAPSETLCGPQIAFLANPRCFDMLNGTDKQTGRDNMNETIAVVTGAAQGIGLALALQCAKRHGVCLS